MHLKRPCYLYNILYVILQGSHVCRVCERNFQTFSSLKRHQTMMKHAPSFQSPSKSEPPVIQKQSDHRSPSPLKSNHQSPPPKLSDLKYDLSAPTNEPEKATLSPQKSDHQRPSSVLKSKTTAENGSKVISPEKKTPEKTPKKKTSPGKEQKTPKKRTAEVKTVF